MLRQLKTDSDLITGIKCRDAECLELFYDHYSSLIYSLISRDISDPYEAEQLLEAVFCKLPGSISLCQPGDRFLTWIILFTQKEIQNFIARKSERQKKIDSVILDLFFMQRATGST